MKTEEYDHKDVTARCLFCHASVTANQRSMAGSWRSPETEDLRQRWFDGKQGPGWLWFGLEPPDRSVCQEFYLCPQHNDPYSFDEAVGWAIQQIQEGEIIDFTDPQAMEAPPVQMPYIESPPLSRWVVEPEELEDEERLPELVAIQGLPPPRLSSARTGDTRHLQLLRLPA